MNLTGEDLSDSMKACIAAEKLKIHIPVTLKFQRSNSGGIVIDNLHGKQIGCFQPNEPIAFYDFIMKQIEDINNG